MQNTANPQPTGITVLTAINIAKITTIVLLVALAFIFGIHDLRQVVYLCLHVGYCLWWLLEQWIYPQRRQIFHQPVGMGTLVLVLLFVGFLYTLPGYLAFTNPTPLSITEVAIALPLYTFGTLINAIADVQKLAAKQHGAGLVSDGIWRFSRNINYFGDLLRYLSFSVVAGSPWAYLVPAAVLFASLQRMSEKDQSMLAKYPDYAEYQKSTARLIPFIW